VETAEGPRRPRKKAFREGGIHLVTVPVDYTENVRVVIDELRSAALEREAGGMVG
jgi:acetolactate synthase I/II/III large subunit